MASEAPGERLREEARCPVCLDFLQDPVSVDCGHSFCLRCISEFCEKSDSTQGGLYACPQCRGPFGVESFRPNRQLASLVDSVRQLGLGAGPAGARHCLRHGEELSSFCEEDQVALCWICDTTPEHRSHRTAPLQEAARGYQVKLQMALEHVRKEMEEALTQEANEGRKTVVWKEKVEMQRQRFRLEFEKYRGFLAQEELLQLRRLEEEERATLQRLRESKSRLVQQSRALKDLAEELEERCQRPALGLLEGVRGALNRSKSVTRLEPETITMELKTMCRIPGMREMLRKFQGPMQTEIYILPVADSHAKGQGCGESCTAPKGIHTEVAHMASLKILLIEVSHMDIKNYKGEERALYPEERGLGYLQSVLKNFRVTDIHISYIWLEQWA